VKRIVAREEVGPQVGPSSGLSIRTATQPSPFSGISLAKLPYCKCSSTYKMFIYQIIIFLKLLAKRKQATLQWLQNPSQIVKII
jgi:hypothetical protein